MKITTTIHYKQLNNTNKRISVFQGSARSGKTYNILKWLIVMANAQIKKIDIVRQSMPAITNSVLVDFKEIMIDMDLWDPSCWRELTKQYQFKNGSVIKFLSMDTPQKKRGAKRDILYINEANELIYDSYQQLVMRTTEKIILDYNPSDSHHWIYDHVIPRQDCDFNKSTYKDNPFLSKNIINEIERWRDTDDYYWTVFGLGERRQNVAQIFTNWELIDHTNNIPNKSTFLGIDFGYNDPTTFIHVKIDDQNIYVDELLYRTAMTEQDIINELKNKLKNLNANPLIFGDSSRPEIIESIKRAGFNIKPSLKGPNSIIDGINLIKQKKLYVTSRSTNLIKELKMYKWRQNRDGQIEDTPIDAFNHCVDALRYALSEIRYGSKYKNSTYAILGIT